MSDKVTDKIEGFQTENNRVKAAQLSLTWPGEHAGG